METGTCYPFGRRLKICSLYPNPIYPNNFLEADPNMYFGLTKFFWFVTFRKEHILKLGHFVDVCHHMGHNDTGDVLSRDVSTFSTFRSGTYRHIIFQAVGPYVAALLYCMLIWLNLVLYMNNRTKDPSSQNCTLGYKNFNNLALPGRWWLEKFNSKAHLQITFSFFEPLRLCLIQSLQKVLIWQKKIIFQKCNVGIKKRKILCWFRKSCKRLTQKRYEQQKIWYLIFISVCKGFSAYNFYQVNFFNRFELSIESCILWYQIPIFANAMFVVYISTFC
jgi:hypothetical protein